MSIHSLYDQRQSFFLAPSSTARGGIIFCILIGLVTFFVALYGGHGTRAWGSYLFNLFFFFSIALGGIAFSGMQDVIGALWGRPVMRLHESFSSFLPVGAIAFVVFFICILAKVGAADQVYRWIREPEMLDHFWGKKDWLKPGFMVARDVFALAVILMLSFWQLKTKMAPDLALMKGDKQKAMEMGLESKAKLRYWSAPILVCYAFAFSLLAFDLTMSLAPTWFSTLWGGWSFAIMMQTLMASLLIFMYALRRTAIGQLIRRQQFHDVGKLMHGFTIFFAYLTYAHVLTYWYGNMPEETEYYIHRLHGPWLGILIVAPLFSFVLPLFGLIPKASKWTAGFTLPLCASILFAQWLTNLVVVIPEVADGATWRLPWVEVGMFLGFLGAFLAAIFAFGKRYPMVAIADPLLQESLAGDGH
jgi:hypothetical protein